MRFENLKKIPDAVATDRAGNRVAIEIERFCKTPKRYQEIIAAHLEMIAGGKYALVHYVCPHGVDRLIKKSFEKIEVVKSKGGVEKLNQAHRERFQFFDFNNWPEVQK